MPDFMKGASIIEKDLRIHIALLEERLRDSWAQHEVAIATVIFFLIGFGMGLVL